MKRDVRAVLLDAVRETNAAYYRLPVDRRPDDLSSYSALEREIDSAMRNGEDGRALRAIQVWKNRHLRKFREAAR